MEGRLLVRCGHEDTALDVSQITRASTVKAKDRGATVWISLGKTRIVS